MQEFIKQIIVKLLSYLSCQLKVKQVKYQSLSFQLFTIQFCSSHRYLTLNKSVLFEAVI